MDTERGKQAKPGPMPSVDVVTMPDGSRRIFQLVPNGKGGLDVPAGQKRDYQKALRFLMDTMDRSPEQK